MSFDVNQFYDLKQEFATWEAAIQRKNASQDKKIIKQRAIGIITTYNEIIECTKSIFSGDNDELKSKIKKRLTRVRERLIKNLETLNQNIDIPTDLTELVKYSEKDNIDKMATKIEYYNLCARALNNVFAGDPLGLTPFINSIELLESMDTNGQNATVLRDFILTKLQGVALESLPPNPSVKEIKDTLKAKIKPESSKVISGKMMAIKADRTNFADYTKKTEQLAEQFKRSLILEGIPTEKANKMTIDKTVELCRVNTQSSVVKR